MTIAIVVLIILLATAVSGWIMVSNDNRQLRELLIEVEGKLALMEEMVDLIGGSVSSQKTTEKASGHGW